MLRIEIGWEEREEPHVSADDLAPECQFSRGHMTAVGLGGGGIVHSDPAGIEAIAMPGP